MKPSYKLSSYKLSLSLTIAAVPALFACGSSPSSELPPNYSTVPGATLSSGCMPINSVVGFVGSNVQIDYSHIKAGIDRATNQNYGTVSINTSTAVTGNYTLHRSLGDGTSIQMQVTPLQGTTQVNNTYPYGTGTNGNTTLPSGLATITGTITLGQNYQSDLQYAFGTNWNNTSNNYNLPGQQYTPYTQTAVCISGIALDMYYDSTGNVTGMVDLYLNNTQHGKQYRF